MAEYSYNVRVYGSIESDDDESDDPRELSDELKEAILEDMKDGFSGGHDIYVYRESGDNPGGIYEADSFGE